jgi:arginine exporter protein ArgO
MVLVFGVFIGSALWWLMLSGGISLFRAKLTPQRLQWINRISGIMIMMFGFMALLSIRT